ncbi:MAG: FAD-binding oxidoreductase [Smithella sp.]
MNTTALRTIQEEFGDRASASSMERELYSRDLGPVPALMVDPLFQTMADLIVRPKTVEEIAALVRRAASEGIPITPRAGATTVFFNAVPVKGGIIIDLNALTGVIALDEAAMTVTVRAATTWSDLEDYLNARGLACKSMPSSAPAATVGGWLCMLGYGIGSLKYGSLLSQVKTVESVLPDGRVRRLSRATDPSLEWLAASEGTLGIVTEVELEIRALNDVHHFLLHVPDNRDGLKIMNLLLNEKILPYNMHFSDRHFVRTMKDLGLSHVPVDQGCLLAVDYEGTPAELSEAEAIIARIAKENTAAILPAGLAKEEWEERFKSIRIKRGGPGILGAEIWLPIAGMPAYLEDVKKLSETYGLNLMSYAHVVSPERALVMTEFFADERKRLQYIISLSLVKKIQDAGYRCGGCPYGVGLWNAPYLGRIYTPEQLREIRKRKKKLDTRDIMNPGKLYRPPFILNPFFFYVAMEMLALTRRIFGKGWQQ